MENRAFETFMYSTYLLLQNSLESHSKYISWEEKYFQTYIAPSSLLDWIKSDKKSISNIFDHRKWLTVVFPMIGRWLAWKVGDGSQIRMGDDAAMGYMIGTFLFVELIQYLQDIGRYTPNLIGNCITTNIWHQGWMSTQDFGLISHHVHSWNVF